MALKKVKLPFLVLSIKIDETYLYTRPGLQLSTLVISDTDIIAL
jgi:hypothetical protein